MFITIVRNGRHETHAAYQRTLAFFWIHAAEGDDITVEEYVVARRAA